MKYPNWLFYFDTIDSTNICATRMIDEGMAHHGDVVWAAHQTNGRGQRGKLWQDEPNSNIAMSLIIAPTLPIREYALLSMLVANTIIKYLSIINDQWKPAIKWPNDIFINDKKAFGILIENSLKGEHWQYAIIGIGINVLQKKFEPNLPNATSLFLESGKEYILSEIVTDLRNGILNALFNIEDQKSLIVQEYNQYLYKRNEQVCFERLSDKKQFVSTVLEVAPDGQLVLRTTNGIEHYYFGELAWKL